MKTLKWFLLISFVIMSTHVACGHRYREASSGKSASEVAELFRGLQSSSSGTNADLQKAIDVLKNNPETTVYFSEAPGDMGPMHAVLPLDFSFVNESITGSNLESARAYLLDLLTEDGHLNYLIIEYKLAGETTRNYQVFSNEGLPKGEVVDEEFTTTVRGDNDKTIFLRSFDVDDSGEDLGKIIQLEVSAVNASGQEGANLGQISSMEGFSVYF